MADNLNHNGDDGETKSTIDREKRKERLFSGIYLATLTGASIIAGFGYTLATARKKDPDSFAKGLMPSRDLESGPKLALRALKWGTFYSVTGFSIFCFAVWKMMGVKNLSEFRDKCGGVLPRVPRNDPPQSRTEFAGLTDLLEHVIELSEQSKAAKQDAKKT